MALGANCSLIPLFTVSGLKDSLVLLQDEESQGLEELLSP